MWLGQVSVVVIRLYTVYTISYLANQLQQQNQNLHSLPSNGFGVGLLERRLYKFCSGFVFCRSLQ